MSFALFAVSSPEAELLFLTRQYTSFTKQQDELKERQKDLDESSKSIEELIEVLDARKDEAIERTFKQVAKFFGEVFEQLVPAGRGRLIMQRREVQRVRRSPLSSPPFLHLTDSFLIRTTTWTLMARTRRRLVGWKTTLESPFASRSIPSRTKASRSSSSREDRRLSSLSR